MASSATAEKAVKSGASLKSDKKLGFFGRIFAFLREVIAELKKVTTLPDANWLATSLLFCSSSW